MKNRAGKTVQNLSGEMAYTSFYPQPLPPQPNIEIDAEMQQLLIDAHKKHVLPGAPPGAEAPGLRAGFSQHMRRTKITALPQSSFRG